MLSRTGKHSGAISSRVLAAMMMMTAVLAVPACSSRSVDNFCTTFYAEGMKFRQSMFDAQRSADPFEQFGSLLGAPDEIARMFEKLETVSPDEIEPDVAAMRDAYRKVVDQTGKGSLDPMSLMGGLANGIMIGLSVSKHEQRFSEYTLRNCGPPPRD
jgi:hypothetical protein